MAEKEFDLKGEKAYMRSVMESWDARAKEFEWKPTSKTYWAHLGSFLQGALAVATATGKMNDDRAKLIAFFFTVGRMDSLRDLWSKEDK